MRGLLAAAVLLVAFAALGAVQPESGIGFPRDVSEDGWRVDWLIQITSVFIGILFVIMCVWMGWSCLAHGKSHDAHHDHGDGKKSMLTALALSALIFLVVDGNLFVNSLIDLDDVTWNFERAEVDPRAVRIEVNARQWAWQVRYAGLDREFNTADDVLALNDVRVPLGAPVVIQLGSVDVIHSLFLPNLRVKQDAIPGRITRLWFRAKDAGQFDIACAQHCGVGHYKMRGTLTVMAPEDYDAWYREASESAAAAFDAHDSGAMWGWTWQKS